VNINQVARKPVPTAAFVNWIPQRFLLGLVGCTVMMACLVAMSGCSHEESTDDLLTELQSTDGADRVWAARMLESRSAEAPKMIPALIKSLEDAQGSVRRSAAISLGYCGAEAVEALPALEQRQHDPDARVREAVKIAIERIQQ
jgi:HEAT repeat protein